MLKILSAFYGTLDVTEILINNIVGDKLDIMASNDIFGDPNPNIFKKLTVEYSIDDSISTKTVDENQLFSLPSNQSEKTIEKNTLKILSAFYGTLNVTEKLINNIVDDKLDIMASNGIFGDPNPNIFKTLTVKYSINDGSIKKKTVDENELLSIPTDKNDLEDDFKKIEKNIKNIFFYWDGGAPERRLKILDDVIYSTRMFNPDRPIYLISNTIQQSRFSKVFNIQVVKWSEDFFDECEIPLTFLREKYFNTSHREFCDLFRIVLLHKFGGSYIDTDDICIKEISNIKNIICRSYDPHTSFYNNITDEQCVDGKYREIRGYDHITMFPRNDCWHNFEPNHFMLKQLLSNEKFLKSEKEIYIGDSFSWQSLTLETIINNIEKIGIDFNFGLTLMYLYEDFVSVSSGYDRCVHGGEMCDIYDTLPNIKNYPWGSYRCNRSVAEDFYNLVVNKYPYLSSMWLHLKDAEKEWYIENLDENDEYLLSTWIYYFMKEKIEKYENSEKHKFSVIIPTLWNTNFIYKLLDDLEESEYVGEIILIDNNNEYEKHINKDYKKINLIKPKTNLYVNPSWNLGVSLAKYDNIAISNDDINFDPYNLSYVSTILNDVGIIGQHTENYYMTDKHDDTNLYLEKMPDRLSAWGCLIFIKKEKWTNIPESLKIACGDDFLLQKNIDDSYMIRNFRITGQISATSLIPEYYNIANEEVVFYNDYVKNIKISVLTLTYQRYDVLEEAIQSYLSQDFDGDSEMVIINDSPDVEYVYDHPNVRIINSKERFTSISAKIGYGYKQCKYNYIYRLDDDDLLAPWALSLTKEYIDEKIGYDVYRSKYHYFFANHNYLYNSDNINNGNVYTKKYLDRIEFPQYSGDEDTVITFGNSSKIMTLDKGYYTMIYRWNDGTYHISAAGSFDNSFVMNYVDTLRKNQNNREVGTIKLTPGFKKDYYSELPKK